MKTILFCRGSSTTELFLDQAVIDEFVNSGSWVRCPKCEADLAEHRIPKARALSDFDGVYHPAPEAH